MSSVLLVNANSLQIPLADKSVHCVVTSPPYWGLRDYGIEGQLGLEQTLEGYVESMVQVFREVKRVLRDDGTLWLNLGDTYASGMRSAYDDDRHKYQTARAHDKRPPTPNGIKPKDLIGIPWRVAFALQADGWYLRSDIIWAKPNPMPESMTDRPTKAHEYIFLLTKSQRYFYDADAVREPVKEVTIKRLSQPNFENQQGGPKDPKTGNRSERRTLENLKERYTKQGVWDDRFEGYERWKEMGIGRNRRTVWNIATAPYSGAHFATYPPALVEPCIKAGCPVGGLVLDPFVGSGTTVMVARQLGRNAIGLDLSYTYLHDQARARLELDKLDAWTNGRQAEETPDLGPLF